MIAIKLLVSKTFDELPGKIHTHTPTFNVANQCTHIIVLCAITMRPSLIAMATGHKHTLVILIDVNML